jgi:hypothetical protein
VEILSRFYIAILGIARNYIQWIGIVELLAIFIFEGILQRLETKKKNGNKSGLTCPNFWGHLKLGR